MSQLDAQTNDFHENFVKSAAEIILYYEGDEKERLLNELKDIVKSYCSDEAKLESAKAIKARVINSHDSNKNSSEEIEKLIQDYKQSISEINPDTSNDKKYSDFLAELNFLTEHLDAEMNAKVPTEDTDEDFEITANVNIIDPITKKRIQCPVKNTICGHIYDKETITELLKMNNKTRCPTIACPSSAFITLANLRDHVAMKIFLDLKYPNE